MICIPREGFGPSLAGVFEVLETFSQRHSGKAGFIGKTTSTRRTHTTVPDTESAGRIAASSLLGHWRWSIWTRRLASGLPHGAWRKRSRGAVELIHLFRAHWSIRARTRTHSSRSSRTWARWTVVTPASSRRCWSTVWRERSHAWACWSTHSRASWSSHLW